MFFVPIFPDDRRVCSVATDANANDVLRGAVFVASLHIQDHFVTAVGELPSEGADRLENERLPSTRAVNDVTRVGRAPSRTSAVFR
jgi:hypothetical protein